MLNIIYNIVVAHVFLNNFHDIRKKIKLLFYPSFFHMYKRLYFELYETHQGTSGQGVWNVIRPQEYAGSNPEGGIELKNIKFSGKPFRINICVLKSNIKSIELHNIIPLSWFVHSMRFDVSLYVSKLVILTNIRVSVLQQTEN